MPTWTVEGASKTTGADIVTSVDAPTEELAREEATSQGILIAAVHQSTADALDVLQQAARAVSGAAATPYYDGILKGSRLLQSRAGAYFGLGVLFIILAIGCLVLGVAATIISSRSDPSGGANIGPMGAGVVGTFTFFILSTLLFERSTMLRLQSELALATRDIARNSFRR